MTIDGITQIVITKNVIDRPVLDHKKSDIDGSARMVEETTTSAMQEALQYHYHDYQSVLVAINECPV